MISIRNVEWRQLRLLRLTPSQPHKSQHGYGGITARNRNTTSIPKHTLNLRQRLPFRLNHVEKADNGGYGSAAAEEEIGTWSTLSE